MTNSIKKGSSLPLGIVLGALIGSAAGLLLAPASGKESRKKLKELTEKLRVDLEKRLSETKNMTEEAYAKTVDTIVSEYSKKEPVIKENAKKLKDMLKGKFKQA